MAITRAKKLTKKVYKEKLENKMFTRNSEKPEHIPRKPEGHTYVQGCAGAQ